MRAGKIAIVGGGPAGSFLAAELSRAGRDVFLFDEKMAWEKPCGGGLTDKALTRWPFLREAPVARNFIKNFELIAPSGRGVVLSLDRQIAIFSRLALNGFLLERARSAGARLIRERVIEIGGNAGQWIVTTKHGSLEADFVVVATGARNSFREQFSSALNGDNFLIALGYYIPGTHQTVHVKFMDGLHGYFWVFPRCDHFSVGICGRMRDRSTAHLRQTLESYLPEFGLAVDGAQFYAHVIPSLTVNTLRSRRFCGQGWAMVGDAAGFVDAITGEGIFYALQSAELLAHALLSNAPAKYRDSLQRELLPELEQASAITDHFYSGEWMGEPVIERMVQLTRRSPRFRDLMRDLCAGAQDYSTLKQRLYRSLPKIVAEALVNRVWHSADERELAIAS